MWPSRSSFRPTPTARVRRSAWCGGHGSLNLAHSLLGHQHTLGDGVGAQIAFLVQMGHEVG